MLHHEESPEKSQYIMTTPHFQTTTPPPPPHFALPFTYIYARAVPPKLSSSVSSDPFGIKNQSSLKIFQKIQIN